MPHCCMSGGSLERRPVGYARRRFAQLLRIVEERSNQKERRADQQGDKKDRQGPLNFADVLQPRMWNVLGRKIPDGRPQKPAQSRALRQRRPSHMACQDEMNDAVEQCHERDQDGTREDHQKNDVEYSTHVLHMDLFFTPRAQASLQVPPQGLTQPSTEPNG